MPVEVARRLGLDYVIAGSKIPGYDAYCRRFGEIDAADYAFLRLSGCLADPLVPDNLKTGVDKPDLYDPKLNRSYAELAEHYDILIDPARAPKPRDKPRVERPMRMLRLVPQMRWPRRPFRLAPSQAR